MNGPFYNKADTCFVLNDRELLNENYPSTSCRILGETTADFHLALSQWLSVFSVLSLPLQFTILVFPAPYETIFSFLSSADLIINGASNLWFWNRGSAYGFRFFRWNWKLLSLSVTILFSCLSLFCSLLVLFLRIVVIKILTWVFLSQVFGFFFSFLFSFSLAGFDELKLHELVGKGSLGLDEFVSLISRIERTCPVSPMDLTY